MKKIVVKNAIAIIIGVTLFFLLGRFVAIPSPISNAPINIQYGALSLISVVYGPIVGALSALIGHIFIDLSRDGSICWSWAIASGIVGLFIGLCYKKLDILNDDFSTKKIITLNAYQIVAHLFAWAVVAPVLDILLYTKATDNIFSNGFITAAVNIITTAIVGTLFCLAYSAAKPKRGNFSKK